MEEWLFGAMMLLMLVAAVEDVKEKKVHRLLLVFMLMVGVIGGVYSCVEQSNNLWQLLGGLTLGICIIGFSLISRGQIGMADGVIITALGMICGARDCLVIVSIASMIMALISIIILIIRKGNRLTQLPFVPALLIGFCIVGWI